MTRAMLTFFSTLAFGVMTAAALFALMPWLSGRTPGVTLASANGLHFESLLLGVVLGLLLGSLGRYTWADVPRRIVTWLLIRERQFFYYGLITCFVGVLVLY